MTWEEVIDRLTVWLLAPPSFDDDDATPNKSAVANALKEAVAIVAGGEGPPERVVADASGGVVFEWLVGDAVIQSIRCYDDGLVVRAVRLGELMEFSRKEQG